MIECQADLFGVEVVKQYVNFSSSSALSLIQLSFTEYLLYVWSWVNSKRIGTELLPTRRSQSTIGSSLEDE